MTLADNFYDKSGAPLSQTHLKPLGRDRANIACKYHKRAQAADACSASKRPLIPGS